MEMLEKIVPGVFFPWGEKVSFLNSALEGDEINQVQSLTKPSAFPRIIFPEYF